MTSLHFAEVKNACLNRFTLLKWEVIDSRYDAERQRSVKSDFWNQRSDCLKPHLDFQLTYDQPNEALQFLWYLSHSAPIYYLGDHHHNILFSIFSLFFGCVNDPLNICEDTHFHWVLMIVFVSGQSASWQNWLKSASRFTRYKAILCV